MLQRDTSRTVYKMKLPSTGVFKSIDNVAVGLHMRHGAGFLPTMLRFPSAARSEASIRARSLEVLEILSLRDRADDLVSSLPYGDQRKVEFARALATEPSLLLLDEPSAGMNPHETTNLGTSIASLHRELGLTIILVEHDMKIIMTHCQRILVMHHGRIQTGLAGGCAARSARHRGRSRTPSGRDRCRSMRRS